MKRDVAFYWTCLTTVRGNTRLAVLYRGTSYLRGKQRLPLPVLGHRVMTLQGALNEYSCALLIQREVTTSPGSFTGIFTLARNRVSLISYQLDP